MWRLRLLLALSAVSLCLAFPQLTQDELNKKIEDVFGDTAGDRSNRKPDPGNGDLGVNNTPRPNPNGQCECVPYYQCQNGTINEDGDNLLDIRISVDNPCREVIEKCCTPKDVVPLEKVTTPPPYVRTSCGQRHARGVGFRIVGGTDEAEFGEFPWMLAVLQRKQINLNQPETGVFVFECGASLIHPQVALTAAHCVANKTMTALKVRAGEWDTQTKKEIYPHQDRDVAKVIIHENFNGRNLHNDFALLILDSPFVLSHHIDVACLPRVATQYSLSNCYSTGWGKDKFGADGHFQVIMKKIQLPIVPHSTCQTNLRTTRLGHRFRLDESFLCAGGEAGKDSCKGDGGSPLVCSLPNNENQFVQVGIVAWGIGCGDSGIPGVYGNVAHARNWIDRNMARNNLDTYIYEF